MSFDIKFPDSEKNETGYSDNPEHGNDWWEGLKYRLRFVLHYYQTFSDDNCSNNPRLSTKPLTISEKYQMKFINLPGYDHPLPQTLAASEIACQNHSKL